MISQRKKFLYSAITTVFAMFFLIGLLEVVSRTVLWINPEFHLPRRHHLKEKLNYYVDRYPFLKKRADLPEFIPHRTLTYLESSHRSKNQQGLLVFNPNVTAESQIGDVEDRKPIFSIKETSDHRGRRISAPKNKNLNHRPQHLLIMGCSLTWGDWVSDHETLPWQLNEIQETYKVYNLGGSGYSAADILARIDYDHFLEDIEPQNGRALYFFFYDHINRFFGTFSKLAPNYTLAYYKEREPYQFEFKGTHIEQKPLQRFWAQLFFRSKIVRLFDLDFPPMVQKNYQVFARFVKVLEGRYHQKFGSQNKFSLVIFPDYHPNIDYPTLLKSLKNENIDVIDYSNFKIYKYFEGPATLPDGHPTAKTYRVLAEMLAHDLSLKEK